MPAQNPVPFLPTNIVNSLFPLLRSVYLVLFPLIWHVFSLFRKSPKSPNFQDQSHPEASVAQLNVSKGGVPKLPLSERTLITPLGLSGDKQAFPLVAVWGGHGGHDKVMPPARNNIR